MRKFSHEIENRNINSLITQLPFIGNLPYFLVTFCIVIASTENKIL